MHNCIAENIWRLFFFLCCFQAYAAPVGYMTLSSEYLTFPFGTGYHGKIYDHLNINAGTIEFWVRMHDYHKGKMEHSENLFFWGKAGNNNSMAIFREKNFVYFKLTGMEFEDSSVAYPLSSGLKSWCHIAATWEKKEKNIYHIGLYVNGKPTMAKQSAVILSDMVKRDIHIGFCKKNRDVENIKPANIDIALFRISRNVRYSASFTPEDNYNIDADTLCFFPFPGDNDVKGFLYISPDKTGIIESVKHEIQK